MGAKDIESGISMASNKKRGCFPGRDEEDRWLLIQKLTFLTCFFVWDLVVIIFLIFGRMNYHELEWAMFTLGATSAGVLLYAVDFIMTYLGWHKVPFPSESQKIMDTTPEGVVGLWGI